MSDSTSTPRSAPSRVFATPRAFSLLVALLICTLPAIAEHTRFWRQSDYDAFQKGNAKGVALRSDGRLVLAPKFAPFADASLAYLWSLRLDSRGNLYAAGGSNAKIVKFDNGGASTTVFESQDMTAQALVFDKNDNFYVATSPDGKVYKVTPAGQKTVFFDPKTKYIWDLALGPDGTLFVATGDPGKIFAVDPGGNAQPFYSAEETHIRTLILDGKGNLLAGTEPNGLVLRIALATPQPAASQSGKSPAARQSSAKRTSSSQPTAEKKEDSSEDGGRSAYVVYETARKEITALALDPSGNLYVAAIGDKSPGVPRPPAQQTEQENAPAGQTITVTVGPPSGLQQPQQATPFVPFPALSSSAVYRIAPDGSPEEVWASRENSIYAMGVSAEGKVLLGTGNQGAIMQLEGDRVFSRLAKAESQQVTSFVRASNGKIYVATANPGKIFTLGPEPESEGTFESDPFDARIFSRWGRLSWWGESGAGSAIELYVRAGNTSGPGKNWSPWAGPYRDPRGQEVECPAARFVQWKAVLHGGTNPPNLSWVEMAYLPKNVEPQIGSIAIQNPGVRVSSFGQQAGPPQAAPVQLRMPAAPGTQSGASQRSSESPRFEPPPQGFSQKGYQAVLWSAEDANDDELTYSVYYRGENEKDWKLLKDKLEQKFYAWDTNSMPDGAYYLKVVASDEKSNPPNEALKAERVSERFVVDNTPPTITEIGAEPAPGPAGDPSVAVRFRASDSASSIVRAQYSLDAGDWTIVPPVGALSDSPAEQYTVTLRGIAPGEHTISVRVYDQFENESAAKVTFTVPAGKR